eukprot:scaffold127432_cov59-Attheya_sp.AAC.1
MAACCLRAAALASGRWRVVWNSYCMLEDPRKMRFVVSTLEFVDASVLATIIIGGKASKDRRFRKSSFGGYILRLQRKIKTRGDAGRYNTVTLRETERQS